MKKKQIICIIPARMNSSRFPGKPMKKINGIPMIGWVYNNVKKNKNLDAVIVATCDFEIHKYIINIGGVSILTSKKHQRASDRCFEALIKYEKAKKNKYDVILMVQGDEPMVNSKMINQALEPFKKNQKNFVVNLISKFENFNEFKNPDTIKVICNQNMEAIFFCRNLPKNYYEKENKFIGKQVCIIPFSRYALCRFVKLKPTMMEIKESIDMWRLLENQIYVKMVPTKEKSYAVDHPQDIKKVSKYLR